MTNQPNLKKEHIPELQLVRAIAIIGVLSVHASAAATVYMKESAYFFFYNFINIFMKYGTPTFILLSSFVLFYSYYNRPLDSKLIASFYKKRLLYIIVPYIIFSVIYFIYIKWANNLPLWNLEALQEFLDKLVNGKVYSHLYFVYISIQFYLLFPLILWAAKRWPRIVYGFVPAGFILQWIFVYFNFYDWQLDNKGSLAPSYFSFFFAGAFMGVFYPKIKRWLAMTKENVSISRVLFWVVLIGAWLGVSLYHVHVYFNARAYGTRYHGMLYEFLWNFHSFFAALVVISLSFFIFRHMPRWISKVLYRMGQLSFGIYLIHLLFLMLYDRYMPSFGSAWMEHLSYFGSWVVMLVASWFTVAIVSRFVPFSWVLFGNVPRKGLQLPDEAPAASKKKTIIAATSLVLVLGVAAAAGYAWLRSNDTVNTNKRQELTQVQYIEEIQDSYDVIVAGTDPEGIAAAISAARNGLSVLLVDGKNREILGGLMTVGGLNTLDLNYSPKKSSVPGKHNFLNKSIFQEWYNKVEGTSFDVNTAANAFYSMVKAEDNIDLLMKTQSMEPIVEPGTDGNGVVKGLRIVKEDGTSLDVSAPSVIDATQDGDLAAAAGAPFTQGRSDIGDPEAQMAVTLVFALKGVTQEIWDSFGKIPNTGIDSMSAWGFHDAANYVSSDPERVKLRGLNVGRQNDDTMLINAMHLFGIDPLDPQSLQSAMELGRTEAPRIAQYLKDTYPEFKNLELAYTFDELYVRETRHIQGEYRLTMADLMANRDHWDAVAYGSYDVDIQATSNADTGFVLYSPLQYGVPFRTLVPQKVDGLLVVGRAASFDSLPHGSARVIPLGMATAEAAGLAAKMASENNITFRELSKSSELIAELRDRLTKQGMELTMNAFETPYYMNHKAYKGLVAAVSMLMTSGNHDNMAYDLDGKSNMQRIVYSMNRVKKQHSDYFHGDPSVAIAGVDTPAEQKLSLDQAVKTIANAMDNEQAKTLTLDEFLNNGWLKQETINQITDQTAMTNGEFFIVLRDVIEYYAGVVYE
ncbi:FAD-dependent oxidoreductase [Paenibacillus sp. NPDC057967]|uniref:FAD-dependent oxidoreductase n=1 Tax=Paenibacillus sp. NPDC057967 TaxID=3346293 RepID=UPI0036DEA942